MIGLVTTDEIVSIRISSEWIGFAHPPHVSSAMEIVRKGESFIAFGAVPTEIETSRVEALLSALSQPPIELPDVINMGFTPDWLEKNIDRLMSELFAEYSDEGKKRFRLNFSNFDYFAKCVTDSFCGCWTDDYPTLEVTVNTKDGSPIHLRSSSQQRFMIPWEIKRAGFSLKTYDAQLGIAIASLMPPGMLNRTRLSGEGIIERAFSVFFWSVDEDLLDRPVCQVKAHEKWIEQLLFTSDGKYVFSASYDAELKSWDTKTWVGAHRFDTRQQGVALTVVHPSQTGLIAYNDARVLKVADVETSEVKQILQGHHWIVRNLAISRDGTYLASADSDEIRVWNVPQGTEIACLKYKFQSLVGFSFKGDMLFTRAHDGLVAHDMSTLVTTLVDITCRQVWQAPDGTWLAWRDEEARIHVWDFNQPRETVMRNQPKVAQLAVSSGCLFLACVVNRENEIRVCHRRDPAGDFTIIGLSPIKSLLFTHDARSLIVCYEAAFEIWDVSSQTRVTTIRTREIQSLSASPDSKTVLTGHRDGSFRVWLTSTD